MVDAGGRARFADDVEARCPATPHPKRLASSAPSASAIRCAIARELGPVAYWGRVLEVENEVLRRITNAHT